MVNIAVLGYGVVGSGVVEVISLNKDIIAKRSFEEVNVKYVLDIRDFKGEPIEKLITHDIDDILNDDSVKVVVEVMGGLNPAYDFVKRSLLKGKSVVTSNKELVAAHGAEFLEIARDKNINFLFEASAGGGIPIIRSIKQALTADDIYEIEGILNGTTNYILSKMTRDGEDFDDVLKKAQDKGYAEKDPTADICGHDTSRKLAILLSLITGKNVDYNDIEVTGITGITKADVDFVKEIKGVIKLMASAKKLNGAFVANVAPVILLDENPLYGINGVFNSVLLKGNAVDELMFYGKGAGKLPTASAVVGDVIDAIRHIGKSIGYYWSKEPLEIVSVNNVKCRKFVRLSFDNKDKCFDGIKQVFGIDEIIENKLYENQVAFITPEMTKQELDDKLSLLKENNCIKDVNNILRME